MPNTVRLLINLGIVMIVTYAGLYAIVTLFDPAPRPMSTSIGKIKLP